MKTIRDARVMMMMLIVLTTGLWGSVASAQNGSNPGAAAGIDVETNATAADIGLPVYPGALRRRDKHDDSSALSFGLWGGPLGVKLIVIKYRSHAPYDEVADFYRNALARYGSVLDCSQPHPAPSDSVKGKGLTCDDDDTNPNEKVYKAGSKSEQRIVSLKKVGDEVFFELVRVDLRGL